MAFRVGGDFFSPAPGRYVGQFIGTLDGPTIDYPASDGKPARKGNTIKWQFATYNLDGTPVVDPKTGVAPAVAEGLSSDTVGMGRGTPAKARVWLTKMLESKGLQWTDPSSADDVNRMVETCKGVFVYLTFKSKTGGGTVLDEMERMQQPAGAAPVVPAAFTAPAPVAAPSTMAPLPVPTAAPFQPTPVPTAAPAVPVMPFPAAQ